MKFWLGTHETHWLERPDMPDLFISHVRLRRRVKLPVSRTAWALDSGGFTELSRHDGWKTTPDEYVDAVCRYQDEIGRLVWAAPMDWMCEPHMLAKTGKSIAEHQHLTTDNYLELRDRGPFIPVLQGWEIGDYLNHIDSYRQAGVDLSQLPLVGVGSVCRRQHSTEIADLFGELANAGLRMHGFGVKTQGMAMYADLLESSDSMAWSYSARREAPMPGHSHSNCANCPEYALAWRQRLLDRHPIQESA